MLNYCLNSLDLSTGSPYFNPLLGVGSSEVACMFS